MFLIFFLQQLSRLCLLCVALWSKPTLVRLVSSQNFRHLSKSVEGRTVLFCKTNSHHSSLYDACGMEIVSVTLFIQREVRAKGQLQNSSTGSDALPEGTSVGQIPAETGHLQSVYDIILILSVLMMCSYCTRYFKCIKIHTSIYI